MTPTQASRPPSRSKPRAALASNAILLLAATLAAGLAGDCATAAAFVAGAICGLTAAYAIMIRM